MCVGMWVWLCSFIFRYGLMYIGSAFHWLKTNLKKPLEKIIMHGTNSALSSVLSRYMIKLLQFFFFSVIHLKYFWILLNHDNYYTSHPIVGLFCSNYKFWHWMQSPFHKQMKQPPWIDWLLRGQTQFLQVPTKHSYSCFIQSLWWLSFVVEQEC